MRCRMPNGFLVVILTVWSSTMSTEVICAVVDLKPDLTQVRQRSMENLTSRAVKGVPSWKVTPFRKWKIQVRLSGFSHDSARAGTVLSSASN